MNAVTQPLPVPTEADMLALGGRLASTLVGGDVVTLSGDLGVGKTTLARGILRGLGFEGRVKSPSYGLIESYELPGLAVHHLDLYRLADAGELLLLGVEDLLDGPSVLLIEWPERGRGYLPAVSMAIRIEERQGLREVWIDRAVCP